MRAVAGAVAAGVAEELADEAHTGVLVFSISENP